MVRFKYVDINENVKYWVELNGEPDNLYLVLMIDFLNRAVLVLLDEARGTQEMVKFDDIKAMFKYYEDYEER